MSGRFIKAYTDLMDSAIWQDDGSVKLYLYLQFRSGWRHTQGKSVTLSPGETLLTQREAAAQLRWSRSKLQEKLSNLVLAGLITVSRARHKTLVRITDFEPGASDAPPETGSRILSDNQPKTAPEAVIFRPDNHSKTPETVILWSENQPVLDRKSVQDGLKISPKLSENQSKTAQAKAADIHAVSGFARFPEASPKNIDMKNIKNTQTYPRQPEPDGFEIIWSAYPASRRTHRPEAAVLFARAEADGATVEAMLSALNADMRSTDWQKEDGQYIPGLVKWLQRESWREYACPHDKGDEEWISR